MDFSLINAGLAAGAALAALPVVLHLFMRQTPKKVVFPALRLIRERQKRSKQRLRVKNWLLLLARMALVALMALALARPTIVSEASVGDRDVPSAIGLVFDTSLSMGYTERDKTRLDEAKSLAADILSRTPGSSLVYVVDSSEPGVPTALSPAAAQKRIEALTIRPASRPLNVAVGQAYTAVVDAERPVHEVYVLTDLARSAWDLDRPAEGLDKAAKLKTGVKTYVLRLTPSDVKDVAVVDARPQAEVAVEGEPLDVVARVRSTGAAATRVAELWLDGTPRGKQTVEVPANTEVEVRFNVAKVDASKRTHQGEVRLTGAPDPLPFNDVNYFTFSLKPPTRVLVVSDRPSERSDDARFIADAIDPTPDSIPKGTFRPYRVDQILTPAFLEKADSLSQRYRCVFLNNVAELSETEWGKLSGYLSEGGGLVIGLGAKVRPESYSSETAAQVLPASLERVSDAKESTFFGQVTDFTHPLFQKYAKELDAMLTQTPVGRHWVVKPREGSRVLLAYADKSPALVERVFKGSRTGRVLLWTTPLSRVADTTSRDAWNDWPIVGWSFFHLMNQTAAYLAGSTDSAPVFEAGRDVVLPIDPAQRSKNYTVVAPDKKTTDRRSPVVGSDSLVINAPQQLGQWAAEPADGGGGPLMFSVNAPSSETQFTPLETAALDKLLGKDRYNLVEKPEDVRTVVDRVKIGREMFPWVMFLILLVITVETILANRFYRETGPRAAGAAA